MPARVTTAVELLTFPTDTMTLREAIRVVTEREPNESEVARRSGVSQPYVNQILNGKRTPSPRVLEDILAAVPLIGEQAEDVRKLAKLKEWDPEAEMLKGLYAIQREFELVESLPSLFGRAGFADLDECRALTPAQVRTSLARLRESLGPVPSSSLPASADSPTGSLRDLFWRLYGQATEELAAEGVTMLSVAFNEEAIDWEQETPESVRARIERLKQRSRKYSKK